MAKQHPSPSLFDMDFLIDESDEPFEQIQETDLLYADFLSLRNSSREVEADSSTQLNAVDDHSLETSRKPLPARVISNRKAQQRFRQKQKAKKAAESSELLYLRQRVQELEVMISRPLDSECTLAQAQTATLEVCSTGCTSTLCLQSDMIVFLDSLGLTLRTQ